VSAFVRNIALFVFGAFFLSAFGWLKYLQIRRRPITGREILLAFGAIVAIGALAWLADYVGL
jgi:hypothetical protein